MFSKKNLSDKVLIQGCLENNRRYQELLYKKYFNAMLGMCMKYTGNSDIAIEIVNTGMMRVFLKIDKYSFKGSLEGWIKKIVFHSLSEYYKKDNRYKSHVLLESKEKGFNQNILEEMYYEDLIDLLQYIPESSANVFKLFVLEGYGHKEISTKLSISEGTSKWHVNNAKTRLKELIESTDDIINVG